MQSRGFAAEAAKTCRRPEKWHLLAIATEAMRLVGTKYRQEKLAIPAVTSSQFVDRDTRYDGLGDIA